MSKKVLFFGLGYGLSSLLSSYLMLHGSVGLWTNILLGTLFFIVLAVFYVKSMRKETGASPFKDIVRDLFLIVLISTVISFVFTQIYYSILSEDDKVLIQERFVQGQLDTYSWLPEEALDDMEDQLIASADEMFSLKNQVFGIPIALGVMALICIVIGLIMKRDPIFDSSDLINN